MKHYSDRKNPLEGYLEEDEYGHERLVIENTRTGGKLYIKELDTPDPFIYSFGAGSKGQEQGGGKAMFQAAASWARNNGIDLFQDSAVTPINQLRRLSNALSSFYRHGGERGGGEASGDQYLGRDLCPDAQGDAD